MKLLLTVLCVGTWIFVTPVQSRALNRFRRAEIYSANETACMVDNVLYNNGDPVPSSDPCEMCICRLPGFACTLTECEEKKGCERVKLPGECCSYKCEGASESPSPVTETKEPDSSLVSSTTVKSQPEELSEVKETTKSPVVDTEQPEETSKGTESVPKVESSEKPEERSASDEETEKVEQPSTEQSSTEQLITEKSKPSEEPVSTEKEEPTESHLSSSEAPSYASGTTKEEPKTPTTTQDSRTEEETEPAKESTDSSLKKEGRSEEGERPTSTTSELPIDSKETVEELSPKAEAESLPSTEEIESSTAAENNKEVVKEEESTTAGLYKKGDESLGTKATTSSASEQESVDASTDAIGQLSKSETELPTKEESTELPSSTVIVDKQEAGRSHEGESHETATEPNETSTELKSEPTSPPKLEEEKKDDQPTSAATEELPTRTDGLRKRFIDWVDYVPRDFHV